MKLQRLIAILTVLLQNKLISTTRLAKMFEVSVRTIYRDIRTLEEAGIPIVTYQGVNGGIGILEQYKIDKKLFTNDDLTTLLTSLNTMSGSISDAKLNQTLEKIKALIPSEQVQSIELSSKQLYIDMTPWATSPRFTENLKQIQQSLEKRQLLQIEYTGRDKISNNRIIEPHQLVLKEGSWYLRAYCQNKNDFRIFKLSRINSIMQTTEKFTLRDFDNQMTDFKDWHNKNLIVVDLLIDESMKETIQNYCKEESIEQSKNGKILVHLPFVESELGYSFLFCLGHHCEILSPDHVRQELIKRIKLLENVYSNYKL